MDKEAEAISFAKCAKNDEALVKKWWNKPHVVEFWDTSPEMWNNFINYVGGNKEIFDYWIGYYNQTPFCLIMTSELEPIVVPDDPYPIDHIIPFLNPNELSIGFDFMIGDEKYLNRGLSYRALKKFMVTTGSFANAFFIDPACNNTKAIHIYKKAGFKIISNFRSKSGSNKGKDHYLMKFENAT